MSNLQGSNFKRDLGAESKVRVFIVVIISLLLIVISNVYLNTKIIELKNTVVGLEGKIKVKEDEITRIKNRNEKLQNKIEEQNNEISKLNQIISNNERKRIRNTNSASRGKSYSVPNINSNFKSYMDLKKITSKSSPQYKFIDKNRSNLWVDELGCYRIDDDYLVALGSAYGVIGDRFEMEFEGGGKITVVKSESKADQHTDSTNRYHLSDNSVVEFLVSQNKLDKRIKKFGGLHVIDKFKGKVVGIKSI